MSVFSKLSIASLLVAAQGVVADDTFGTKVVLNEDKKGFTGLDWKKVTPGSVFTLVNKAADGTETTLETVTAQQGEATEWTLDGKTVTAVDFVETSKEEKKPATNMQLKLKLVGSDEKAAKEMTLELDEKKALKNTDAEKFKLADGEFAEIVKGTKNEISLTDEKTKYTVVKRIDATLEEAGKPASYTVESISIEGASSDVSFEKKDEEWTAAAGDYEFKLDVASFANLVKGSVKKVKATHKTDAAGKSMEYTVSNVVAAKDGEANKQVLTLKEADASIDGPITFEEKGGKFICNADGDNKDKVLAVVKRADMTFEKYPTQKALEDHMLTEASKEGQQWYLNIAESPKVNESWWKSAMNWVYISLAVVAVAVICFFVFGGKKDTESDDESDLDTSDDEEEDAAATEAKEEEA